MFLAKFQLDFFKQGSLRFEMRSVPFDIEIQKQCPLATIIQMFLKHLHQGPFTCLPWAYNTEIDFVPSFLNPLTPESAGEEKDYDPIDNHNC